MKKMTALLLCFCMLFVLVPAASAERDAVAAERLETALSGTGYTDFSFLTDGNVKTYKTSSGDTEITVESEEAMHSLYLMFDLEYGRYTVVDNNSGKYINAGEYGFLHEYIDLTEAFGEPTDSVTLKFVDGAVRLSELYAFSMGETPDYVQKWAAPLDDQTDLMLLATHGDDDQLFFAGLLPYYAAERGLAVQVVYLTDHRNLTYARTHEMLNGLWSVGVTAYPVFGEFADFRIDSLQGTYDYYESLGTSKDDLQAFVVEQIRRFKPQVVVGHDINGEYGHGMHMVYTDLLINAIDLTGDSTAYPASAEAYGTFEMPKVYIHLYEEDPIVIDYDQPLASFGGMTAFEVTQKYGYPCHESQQYTWFTDWINGKNGEITKASQIRTYDPSQFGLYHTTVGADVAKNDFFENMTTYEEQARIAAEKAEAERLEQERLEQERLEAERAEQERLENERQQTVVTVVVIVAAAVVLAVGVAVAVLARKRATRRKK